MANEITIAPDNDEGAPPPPPPKKTDSRKVFMAGYFAGVKAASGANAMLNAVQYAIRESNLTLAARKVLGAVPIQGISSTHDILAELIRVTSLPQTHEHVAGCLNSLKEAGLINEPTRGHWQRVKVRQEIGLKSVDTKKKTDVEAPAEAIEAPPQPTPPDTPTPLEKLAQCATQARGMAKYLEQLADAIETAALDYENEADKDKQQTEKLAQLRALLKEI